MDTSRDFGHKSKYPVRGNELDQLRESRGLSLERLAQKAGIHIKSLKRILAGGKSRLQTIDLLAKALGVSCNELRADIPRKDEQELTCFSLDLTIHGTMESIRQLQDVLNVSPAIKALLEQSGIMVSTLNARLQVLNQTGEVERTIALLYGIMNNGTPFWVFAAVIPSRYSHFISAYSNGVLDIHDFGPYGEIIVIGEGHNPTDYVIEKVAEMYQITPHILMSSMHHQPPPKGIAPDSGPGTK